MADTTQSYENHVRWHPPFHFFLVPLFLLNLIFALVQLIRIHDLNHAVWFAVSFGFCLLTLLTRLNSLRVQDRLIRLEEQLRYQRVLPADLAARASSLSVRSIVSLRFASDEELGSLVQQVLDGKLKKGDEIKRAIKQWRPDTFRV
jgi:hypothetical protein